MASEPSQFEWAEPLPPNCPPADANPPNNEQFYRLVDTMPPKDEDFYSSRKLHPDWSARQSECIESACSLFDTFSQCVEQRKFPLLRAKMVAMITLPPESGFIRKTVSKGHCSWWRAKGFDPIAHCQKAEPTSV